ncbi:putative HECT domain-containing protein [Plasmopara halstedii]
MATLGPKHWTHELTLVEGSVLIALPLIALVMSYILLRIIWKVPESPELSQRIFRSYNSLSLEGPLRSIRDSKTSLIEEGEVAGDYEIHWYDTFDFAFVTGMIVFAGALLILTYIYESQWLHETKFWVMQLPKLVVMMVVSLVGGIICRCFCDVDEKGYIMTNKSSKFKVNYTRKLQHFAAYMVPLVIKSEYSGSIALAWGDFFTMLGFLVLIKPIREHSKFFMLQFNSLDRPEDRPHTLKWIILGNIAPGMLILMFFKWLFAAQGELTFILVFITGIGDGLAEPVGITWGRHKYKTRSCFSRNTYTRSWEGSACVFLSGLVFPALQYAAFDNFWQVLLSMLILAPTMAYAEATAPHTMDTPVLMIGCGTILYAVVHIFRIRYHTMFLRDNELARGGRVRRDDRTRVLQLAREQRKERERRHEHEKAAKVLHAFVRGRLTARRVRTLTRIEFDQKLSDICNLKTILQLPNMPLSYHVLFELLQLLQSFYTKSVDDVQRLQHFSLLFIDALAAAKDGIQKNEGKEREWKLQRLVDMCLQCGTCSASVNTVTGLQLVRMLMDLLPEVKQYLLSGQLTVMSQQVGKMLYSEMPSASVIRIIRQEFLLARNQLLYASCTKESSHCNALMEFVVHLLTMTSEIQEAFVMEILSVPLLNQIVAADRLLQLTNLSLWVRLLRAGLQLSVFDIPASPVSGIASEAWLLGNILWLSERVESKSDAIVLSEVQLLSKLLQSVPPVTYAASGVAVSWTKVSESHSVPVVFPDALNEQLRILVHDQYLRAMCNHLLSFSPSALRHPLATQRPIPMYPEASTIAEQFGFGDIASASSLSTSLSITWQKVKSIGKATWARNLLQKAGLRRRQDDSGERFIVDEKLQFTNTSKEMQQQVDDDQEPAAPIAQHAATAMLSKAQGPFELEKVKALSCLCGTFLFRWGNDGGKRQSYAMRLLNTLAFYHVETVKSEENATQCVSLVEMLWCVLQDTKNFEVYARNVDLIHARSSDPYVCMLLLFCMSYEHLLVVMDDEEMYEQEYPLPLCQIERIVLSLKHALYEAYWTYAHLAPSTESVAFGMFVVEMGTRLMRVLYNRCSRQPFCNVTSWIIAELNSSQLIEEVLFGTPRANKLIQSMPYLVPFSERVKLFQRLVKSDKEIHQNENSSVYRIRIHRSAILQDGLRKLNTIRANLKKRINVVFVNAAGREEMGIDAGGLFKEFWLDLSTLAFDLQYGLFLTTHDELLYPNPSSASGHFSRESDHLTMFQFVGRILGKALYEGIVVQPKFAHFFLSKLLHSFNHLNELPSLDPEIYRNLMFLKSYEGDVEDLGLTHTIVQEVFGEQKEIEIIPGGGNIPVTNRNKTRYIHLVANYYLNTQIREQCAAFRMGLSDLIDPRWLQMFNEPELQVLISGKSGKIDVDDLQANTRYTGGYYAMDKRVAWLWQALASFTPSEQAAFLRFTTSCQRAPSLGFASLTPQFCVQKVSVQNDDELLPSSSTCFNTLKLPTYSSYKVLRAKLLTSISAGAGFEMT